MRLLIFFQALVLTSILTACAGGQGMGVSGNEAGTAPLNKDEERDYKRAILKCYKTGGSRIVKIEGKLMCY
ncbi:MAG: hypothetical protein NTX25_16415 [Proteobacteria bacterium]|nr:hypothetical protein [Pseudomonadota bacterium]